MPIITGNMKTQVNRRGLEMLADRLHKKGFRAPYVIRTSRDTAVKIAEALSETWRSEVKSKQVVGDFLIIA